MRGKPVEASRRISQLITETTPRHDVMRDQAIAAEVADLLTRPASQSQAVFDALSGIGAQRQANQSVFGGLENRFSRRLGLVPGSSNILIDNKLNDMGGRNAAPVGGIIDFAGEIAPSDWLFCNGQAVSRTDYPYLFTIIGTTYGAGDGVTTFNMPDLRGYVVAGADNMGGAGPAGRLTIFPAVSLGATGGAQSHALTIPELAAHSHAGTAVTAGAHNHTGNTVTAGAHLHHGVTIEGGSHSHAGATDVVGNHTHPASYEGAATPLPGPYTASTMQSTAGTGATPVNVTPAGAHSHTLVTNAAGVHSHAFTTTTDAGHTHGISTDGAHAHAVTTVDTGAGAAHLNVQPTFIMNKIIRAR